MANKARRQQLAAHAAAERRKQRLIYIVAGGVAVVVLAAALIFFFTRSSSSATAAAVVDDKGPVTCGPIQSPPDEGNLHLTPGETPTYHGNPPSSGTHNPIPLAAGIYDQPVDVTMEVHSLEHGYINIHYNGVSQASIDQLKQIVSRDPRKLILSPFPGMPYKVSLTAWDHLQTCTGVDEQVIQSFIASFRDKGPENVP